MSVAQLRLSASRVHYAWVVAGVMFVVILSIVGVRAAPSVLIVPMEQALGYTGAIPAESARRYAREGYLGTEHVGLSGVEAMYESYLHGKPGETDLDGAAHAVRNGAVVE